MVNVIHANDGSTGGFYRCINFLAETGDEDGKEERYRINLDTDVVDKLVVGDMSVSTLDFSTKYGFNELRDNILTNIRQAMFNQIVQKTMDSTLNRLTMLKLDCWHPETYVDMFTDNISIQNFKNMLVKTDDQATQKVQKFTQVFKNNIHDISIDGVENGNIYGKLRQKVDSAFGNGISLTLVDSP